MRMPNIGTTHKVPPCFGRCCADRMVWSAKTNAIHLVVFSGRSLSPIIADDEWIVRALSILDAILTPVQGQSDAAARRAPLARTF